MRNLFPLCALLLATGCASDPYTRPPLPKLKNPNPQSARDDFRARLPDSTHALNASSLQFPFNNNLTVLEQVDADPAKNQFDLQGYMPMGMLLFDVSVAGPTLTVNSAASELEKYKFIVEAIGRDLRHVYLDLSPAPSAKPSVYPKEILFTQKTPDGTLSYEYAYNPPVLIEKRLSNFWGTIWRIRFYDYRPGPDGKLRPSGVLVDDKRYFYRIVLSGHDLSQKDDKTAQPKETE